MNVSLATKRPASTPGLAEALASALGVPQGPHYQNLKPSEEGEILDATTAHREIRIRGRAEFEDCLRSLAQEPAQLILDIHRSNPEAAYRLAQAVSNMPPVGSLFAGFLLLQELGKGAFGRVFLAQQGTLANRHVVLKISPDVNGESQTLAQLQHTNVVPIYSVHMQGSLKAVCMPYFGTKTLAEVLKELRGRESLPESGTHLVSTLIGRKSTARDLDSSKPPSGVANATTVKPAMEVSNIPEVEIPSASQGQGSTAVLEMLKRYSYIDAVLWIASRLADGLAHAHEHGIVHRDLKPANILLTDEGQPMLLDFNLAHDTKMTSLTVAQIGGTLPYMAPEQLEAFRNDTCTLNYNGDLYSLGVILYELLTGRHPFAVRSGHVKPMVEAMIHDRRQAPPSVRTWNASVSPAVESIVHHCLQPNPAQRYQSARELQEDLQRQLDNLPLKHAPEMSWIERAQKWVRRHPRLTSTTSVAAIAAVLLAGLCTLAVVRTREVGKLQATASLNQLLDEKKTIQYILTSRASEPEQIANGLNLCREALSPYQVLDNPSWTSLPTVNQLPAGDRDRLHQGMGELLLLYAHGLTQQAHAEKSPSIRRSGFEKALQVNHLAEASFGQQDLPRALWSQRADLAQRLGKEEESRQLYAQAKTIAPKSATDQYLMAYLHIQAGRWQEAVPYLRTATADEPQNSWGWLMLGMCHDAMFQHTEAIACYSTNIALAPNFASGYVNRGLAYHRQQSYQQACDDFNKAIQLDPSMVESYLHRAQTKLSMEKPQESIADLTKALELGASKVSACFFRAQARDKVGDRDGAKLDREEALRSQPTDELDWLCRGTLKLSSAPVEALGDVEQGLRLNPRSLNSLRTKAHLLARLGRTEESLAVLNRILEMYPDFTESRAARGVLLARLKQRDAALKDARECLMRDKKPLTIYLVADIYALTSLQNPDDARQALRHLASALRSGCGFDYLETDKDLDPIRNRPEFKQLVEGIRAFRGVAQSTQGSNSPLPITAATAKR